MANPPPTNYAYYVGIKSTPAAAVAAAIYAPLLLYYIFRATKNAVMTIFLIVLFCLIRLSAFGLRAYIAAKTSAQQDRTLVMVESIMYGVGFLGLLNGAYNLQIDRSHRYGKGGSNIFSKLTGNPGLVHLALTGAVVLSVIGTIDVNATDVSEHSRGKTFRIISAIAFAAINGLLVLRCLFSLKDQAHGSTIGARHGGAILLLISCVFLVREIYLVGTVNNATASRNEVLFYVLEAVPELIGVLLMATPGLIPSKYDNDSSLPTHYGNNNNNYGGNNYANNAGGNVYAPSGNNVYAPQYKNDSEGYLMK
jgi:hypothetical protein